MPAPLPHALREAIADDIRAGTLGRNAIARKHHVSTGMVSKVARTEGLWFERCIMTATGTRAQQADCALRRLEREAELLDDYLTLPETHRRRDGRETKAARKLSYKLYDLHRHHS